MLVNLLAAGAGDTLRRIRDSDPEEDGNVVTAFVNSLEVAIEFLKGNAEFRDAFARVHAEFMKYPESKEVLQEALRAKGRMNEQDNP